MAATRTELEGLPGLVVAEECDHLRARLASVQRGEAFLLQGGDCAETFSGVSASQVRDKLRTILQMAVVLTYGASLPVVKVGRMAGQFAKPRSAETEAITGLPSYRGDAVNDLEPTLEARTPRPERMLKAYHASAATLNLIRAYTRGGLADLRQVHDWNKDFVRRSPAGERYEAMATEIDRALAFMQACGIDLDREQSMHGVEFFASHEALLLDYETPLTRSVDGRIFDLSAHLLWIGDRTRSVDGGHVAFASRIANPIAVKLGPSATGDDVLALADVLDPDSTPGRLTFVTRLGAARVEALLPPLVEKARAAGLVVTWVCDPMHGNTILSSNGVKTRRFDDVIGEVRAFFGVMQGIGGRPGGIHVELTGDDVTECLGGGDEIDEADLAGRYETACDPRLNTGQALELAFLVAEMLRG